MILRSHDGVAIIKEDDWYSDVSDNEPIDVTGLKEIIVEPTVTAFSPKPLSKFLDRLVNSKPDVVTVKVPAYLMQGLTIKSDYEGIAVKLYGTPTVYSSMLDPYALFSPFTKPRKGEDISMFYCDDTDVNVLNLNCSYLDRTPYVSVAKDFGNMTVVLGCEFHCEHLTHKVHEIIDAYHTVFSDIHSHVTLVIPSDDCAGEIGYRLSVLCNGKLYTAKECNTKVLEEIVFRIRNDSPLVENLINKIKHISTTAIMFCTTESELLDLIKSKGE